MRLQTRTLLFYKNDLNYISLYIDGLGSTVKCKRNYSEYTLPYKSTPAAKKKTILSGVSSQEQSVKKEQDLNENVYIYREGTVPPSRQMFYQVYYHFYFIIKF